MSHIPTITGLGLITPLARGADDNWRALLAGEYIRDHARVPRSLLLDHLPEPASTSRVSELAMIAAREAAAHAGWGLSELRDPLTAIVVGTSKGPVEAWLEPLAGRSLAVGLAEVANHLAREFSAGNGPRTTLSAACASGLHALIHASLMLRSGTIRRAIVVATEASVHPLFIGSFKRLGVLPPEGVGCRPFDTSRAGFLISEAAAAVCVEAEACGRAIASVDRMAMAGDATHITSGDTTGRTMRRVLADVAADHPVDLFHAHATGTPFHDPIELAAIEAVAPRRGGRAASVYSHKGAIGHSLGASGLVSVVLSCLAHRHGKVPANVRTSQPLPVEHVCISNQAVERPIQRSIAFAAGFGGAMAAVSLLSAR